MSSEPTAGDARTDEDASTDEKTDDNTAISPGGPLANLTDFQRDLLWVLAKRGGSKGLAIKQALETYYSEHVNHGRLYPNLDELVDAGLVNKGRRDMRTNEYSLTSDGRESLQKRIAWTADAEVGE